MARYHRAEKWRAGLVCCLLLSLAKQAQTLPNPGGQTFLGFNYWNSRYSLDYTDWDGFWNSNFGGRNMYNRDTGGSSCVGCTCSNQEATCTGSTVNIRYYGVQKLNPENLVVGTTEITIFESGLKYVNATAFHNLTGLKKLNLAQNELTDFPDISKNSLLEELDLYANKIQLFSHNFTSLPKALKRIILIDNLIDWIPNEWFDLPDLEYLALSKNKLKKFPSDSFINCRSLRYLSVDQNEIGRLSVPNMQPFFGNDSALVHLNASNNQISAISTGAFSNLIHLKVLELHVNHLETIATKVFYQIPELLHLDLRGNRLKTITAEGYSSPFDSLPKLKVLILMQQQSSYQTERVMFNAFKDLPALEDLFVANITTTTIPYIFASGKQ
ncbi:lumican-like [Stylophora pistillata]|uniref:lumican-like n=1 Tax=Stylophora pistillata TaxID=50429 RepID=UPI000C04DC3B|nr:lumican-like [Stylophora pistillata]